MTDKIKGVISMCNGDRRYGMFLPIDVVLDHPIFTRGELAPVPTKIGLELLALQVPPFTKTLNPMSGELDNQPVTYIMIDTVSGFASPKWQQAGTTLFARKDKKPLTVNHIEALWMFNDDILGAFGDGAHRGHAKMNRDAWNRFWINYKEQQIGIIRQFPMGRDRSVEIEGWENSINPLEI
ncbi:hypothetical protein HA402_007167 [Bradysia odoriphaga]|nr:hypothetical protein HA402_007167 [Bradysia odoriphaga]